MVRIKKNNRGSIDIRADILNLSTEAIGKTHIMYGANLSYEQVSRYIGELQEKGFLEEVEAKRYIMTEKGRLYRDEYEAMKRMMDSPVSVPVYRMYGLA